MRLGWREFAISIMGLMGLEVCLYRHFSGSIMPNADYEALASRPLPVEAIAQRWVRRNDSSGLLLVLIIIIIIWH